MEWIAIAIFAVTIVIVIANVVDSTVAALLGVVAMVWIGVMTETDAFTLVDWNVMAILVSIWIIASYFGKSGHPELAVGAGAAAVGRAARRCWSSSCRCSPASISMFVDNVVVILMFAPVALPLARALRLPLTPLVLMIGFCANFMGSAMLLGDLPPQMMHSVSGAEFFDFFWHTGTPVVVPDPPRDLRDHARRDVLRTSSAATARQAVDVRRLGIETRHPEQAVRHHRRRLVPRHRRRHGLPRAARREAGLHRDDRGARRWCWCSSSSASG